MGVDVQELIEKLEERKRKLLEEVAEVDFHLKAAIKYTRKRKYNPTQLALARANKGNVEESGS